MTNRLRRVVASALVAMGIVSVSATPLTALVGDARHMAMPCCDEPDDCAVRLSAVSCCEPGQVPDATAPTPVVVSVTVAKMPSALPGAQPVAGSGLVSRSAGDAFVLACLKLPHDPPHLRHSVLLI